MTIAESVDRGRTRDQLGTSYQVGTDANQSGDVKLIIIPPFRNDLVIEQLPTLWQTRLIGTAFILGHSDNGILGTSALGEGTMGDWTTVRVTSVNNTFIDWFKDSQFNDTTISTASWDTTNQRWEFAVGDIGQTGAIFQDKKRITKVKPMLVIEGIQTEITLNLTANPGSVQVNLT